MPIGIIVVVIIIVAVFVYVKTRPQAAPQAVVLPASSSPTGTTAVVVPVTPTGTQPSGTPTVTPTVVVPITPVTASPGPYLWDPLTISTQDPTQAVFVGTSDADKVYVAAIKNSSGQMVLGKSNGVYIWYPDNGVEKYAILSQGYLLPASAVPGATWNSVLNRGVALTNAPANYVCRANMTSGIHSGSFGAGACNVPWGGQVLAKTAFEYLNI